MSRVRTIAVTFVWLVLTGMLFGTPQAAAQARLIIDDAPTKAKEVTKTATAAGSDSIGTDTRQAIATHSLPDSLRFGHSATLADSLAHAGIVGDSLLTPYAEDDTARLAATNDSLLNVLAKSSKKVKERFVPNPKRALWLSLIFPGAGQIYNRKYWKLPFIYGGFLGCTYALMWNQQMYKDYSQAYLDIMDDDPTTNSYLDMLPLNYDITGREEQFQNRFKSKKNYYRRYRDLSVFCFIGVYLISVIDAYVDAQLSVFDISPDLTMSLEPAVISTQSNGSTQSTTSYGVGCSLRF
ncbi:MAG: DUF5683 domain-containing protein [Bacteroidales bacterium]|nr:DUF5683 domain-containing protein [Bacteroidales bacterium]